MTPEQKAEQLYPIDMQPIFPFRGEYQDVNEIKRKVYILCCTESQAEIEREAVEFAEWISKKGYKLFGGKWEKLSKRGWGEKDYYTTAQLYEQFKNKK